MTELLNDLGALALSCKFQNPICFHFIMEVAKIRVAVRKRPLTRKEIRHNEEDIID